MTYMMTDLETAIYLAWAAITERYPKTNNLSFDERQEYYTELMKRLHVEVSGGRKMEGLRESSEYKIGIDKLAHYASSDYNVRQLMEECGELVQASNKLLRVQEAEDPDPTEYDVVMAALLEEIADVQICTDIVLSVYDIDSGTLDDIVKRKMTRNLERLNKTEPADLLKRAIAAHECCGGCVD